MACSSFTGLRERAGSSACVVFLRARRLPRVPRFRRSRRKFRRHLAAGDIQQCAKCGGLRQLGQQHAGQVRVRSHQSLHQLASNGYQRPNVFRHSQAASDDCDFRRRTESRRAGVYRHDDGERLVIHNHTAGIERNHHRIELARATRATERRVARVSSKREAQRFSADGKSLSSVCATP